MTMITLWSALPSQLWHSGGPQEKEINEVLFWLWYYGGFLMTMTLLGTRILLGFPYDYEIMEDP